MPPPISFPGTSDDIVDSFHGQIEVQEIEDRLVDFAKNQSVTTADNTFTGKILALDDGKNSKYVFEFFIQITNYNFNLIWSIENKQFPKHLNRQLNLFAQYIRLVLVLWKSEEITCC